MAGLEVSLESGFQQFEACSSVEDWKAGHITGVRNRFCINLRLNLDS